MSEKAHIPYNLLWPTQGPKSFRKCSEHYVKNQLQSEGVTYFERVPLEVTALEAGDNTTLALTDGHHGARWAPAYVNVVALPAIVLTIDEYNDKQNKLRVIQNHRIISAVEEQQKLEKSIIEAEQSFDQSMRSKFRKRARRQLLNIEVRRLFSILKLNPLALLEFLSQYQMANNENHRIAIASGD